MTSLDQSLISIKDAFLNANLQPFQYFACGIGLIVTIIYIGWIASESLMKAESINYHAALRPVAIAFLISVYPDLVVKPLDYMSSLFNNILTEQIIEKKKSIASLNSNVEKNIAKRVESQLSRYGVDISDPQLQEYIAENRGYALGESFAQGMSDSKVYTPSETELKNFIEQTRPDIEIAGELGIAGSIAVWFIALLEKISGTFIRVISMFCLLILSLFGPITFALSILPAFVSSLSGWFARYIQISLWIPLSQIFTYILLSTQEILLSQSSGGDAISSPNLALLVLSAVSVIGMFMIPTISEWIIQSSGASTLYSGISRGLGSASRSALGFMK